MNEKMQTIPVPMKELVPVLLLQMEQGGTAALTVTGTSMLPMLHNRQDTVFLQLPPQGALPKGTVALYQRDSGIYVLHRLMKPLEGERYLCCGDNQWQTEVIRFDQVIAVVTAFERNGKRIEIDSRGYRLYVKVWSFLLPVRRPILLVRRLLGKIKRLFK